MRKQLPVINARLVNSLSEVDWFRALPKVRVADLRPLRPKRHTGKHQAKP
jgi:hypothetical protein